MQFHVPELAVAGIPVSGLLGLAAWLVRKHGIATALATILLILGSMTCGICLAAFTVKLFGFATMAEDAAAWLCCGTGFGMLQLIGAATARYVLPHDGQSQQTS